jgi:uncharacterized membrane protein YphA (DoxX/SURF4 family)
MVDNIATHEAPSAGGMSRGMNITLWVLQGILALGFLLSGLSKLAGAEQAVQIFEEMGTAGWMPYVIGVLEIAGAIGLLIRRLTGLAAAALVLLLIGALISHAIWGGFAGPAVVLLILSAVVAYFRRSSISELLAGSR